MLMPVRSYSSTAYKYGFNGQEKDDEVAGSGNINTAMFWEYDTRLGRRWNVDPVVKPWQSRYDCFSDNPIWRVDPNGDDDIFNSDGTFKERNGSSTNIKIMTADGPINLSAILPNSPENILILRNVVNHYREQAGISKNIPMGISPSVSVSDGAIGYANSYGIFLCAKNGISPNLNNYNNLINTLVHEKFHLKHGDDKKDVRLYTYSEHMTVYEDQLSDKSFANTDLQFKIGAVANYLGYMKKAYEEHEIDGGDAIKKVDELNQLIKGYDISVDYNTHGNPFSTMQIYSPDISPVPPKEKTKPK